MWASSNNQLETVKFLMEKGADFNLQGNQGETPLLLAAAHGHTQVVASLLQAGMEINKTCQVGKTCFFFRHVLRLVNFRLDNQLFYTCSNICKL